MINFQIFQSQNPNVCKYVFEGKDMVTEAVLYKYESYEKRTVLCVSVQSGCPVGCTFCGTGKKFIRNLTKDEIVLQVKSIFFDKQIDTEKVERLQIMFMSMGEPFLNYENVHRAIDALNVEYPNAELLISTVGIKNIEYWDTFMGLSHNIEKLGLQFSIHESSDEARNALIPFKNKLTLREIRNVGLWWNNTTKRPVFLNYCCHEGNSTKEDVERLMNLFPPSIFNFTFSVVCSSDEDLLPTNNYKHIEFMSSTLIDNGYNVRQFDPAGQDDIGGGSGQLWYVQKWMSEHGI